MMPVYDCGSPDCVECEKAFGPDRKKAIVAHRSRIVISFEYPPIHIRSVDWSATLDGYEPGDPIGHGATEADAISDLLEQMEGKPE